MLTREFADHFAAEWIAAWNSHELDRILAHYSDDFTMSSTMIASVVQEPSGTLQGKAAIGAYWAKALARIPDLHFTLIHTFVGAGSLAIHYQGARGPAVEVFFFNDQGLVQTAAAHY
jgi:ketosteroid isomerase-like protein